MRKAFFRQLKLIIAILLGYLLHVVAMPDFPIFGAIPSMLIAMTAIVTVGYGKLRALWTGCFYGIVTETMLPTVPMLNLLLYPVSALLCSVFFADKSAARLQYERSAGKAGRNLSPLLRTVLCAAMNAIICQVVMIVYTFLGGAVFTSATFLSALASVGATTVMTAIIMVPVRKLLGFRKPAPENPVELRFGRPLKLEEDEEE